MARQKNYYLEILVGIFVMALGLFVIFESQGFSTLPGNDYGGGLFPQITGLIMLIGGVVVTAIAVKEFLSEKAREGGAAENIKVCFSGVNAWAFLPLILIIMYVFLSESIGAIEAIFIILMIMFLALGIGFIRATIVSVSTSVFIWATFVYLLKVPLPYGYFIG